MKYPIDPLTTETMFGHLIQNDRAQKQLILALSGLLREAMDEMGAEDTQWYDEADKLFKIQAAIKVDHENRLFNAKNGHPDRSQIEVQIADSKQVLNPMTGNMDKVPINVPGATISPEESARLTENEKGFGEELSEADLARMFGESNRREKPKPKVKKLKDMSQSEINRTSPEELQKLVDEAEEDEQRQENSNDIYKIKGRVQNLAVGISGGNLTPVGEMMVNSFVHVVKDLYDFAETIQDKSVRVMLIDRIRKHEGMPGNLISAATTGVKGPKK